MKTDSLVKSDCMKAGLITLQPGEEVGEHVTEKREELLIVLEGTATLRQEDKELTLQQHATHYISEGVRHNVVNNTKTALKYVYVVALQK